MSKTKLSISISLSKKLNPRGHEAAIDGLEESLKCLSEHN